MSKILVPTDFSPASENAIEIACQFSLKGNHTVELLHVKGGNSSNLLKSIGKSIDDLETHLSELSREAKTEHGVEVVYRIEEGNFMAVIPAAASEMDVALMIIGTHGSRGLRQKLFGADALKLAGRSMAPVLAVPDDAKAKSGIKRIIFPYGSHGNFDNKTAIVGKLANSFGADVHFYSINKPSQEASKEVNLKIKDAAESFEADGIKVEQVREEMKEYSVGFANQTLKYAEESGADVIAVMANDDGKLAVISSVDRESLINNDRGISILLVAE